MAHAELVIDYHITTTLHDMARATIPFPNEELARVDRRPRINEGPAESIARRVRAGVCVTNLDLGEIESPSPKRKTARGDARRTDGNSEDTRIDRGPGNSARQADINVISRISGGNSGVPVCWIIPITG